MTSTRHLLGSALWVVSCLALALVAVSVVASVFGLEQVDPPGPGLVYVLISLTTGFVSRALLEEGSA